MERDALRLLASREHSRLELRRKLCARGFDEKDIERLLDDLCDRGQLSEERMAETYVAARVGKGFGPVRIRGELRQRGLSDDIIRPYLEKSAGEWSRVLSAAHDKRFGHARPVDGRERARRARFLEYRGFPTELIASFLNGEAAGSDTEFI
jgi:regulatory protein